ncbi:YIP1 family protein [Candidatus Palauibacter sp.]|uniref:YIP1 family protein n=1 Tax=Candidatus Palauibacter sp. TaxID=3101350 RepID=UPI003B02A0AA
MAFPGNLTRTWWRSAFQPAAFFAGAADRTIIRPVLYFLIVAVLVTSLWLAWGAVLPGSSPGPVQEAIGLFSPALVDAEAAWSRPALLLATFFLTPLAAVLYLVVRSLIIHLAVVLLAPGRRPFAATVRTICYASGPWLFSVVPWVGVLVGVVWEVVLTVVGLREAHRMSTGRACATWLIALIIPLGGILFAALLAIISSVA